MIPILFPTTIKILPENPAAIGKKVQDGEKGVEGFHNVGVLAAHFKVQAYGRLTILVLSSPF